MADAKGMGFIDTLALVPKDKSLFIDHAHTTEKGDEAIAEIVSGYILEQGLLDRVSTQTQTED